MTEKPEWLPETLHFNGNWDEFIESVYEIFERDFKRTKPVFGTLPVKFDSRIENGKEAGFWHIVQKEDFQAKERLPDIRRCEHIPWPKPIIEHSSDKAITIWKNDRKTNRNNSRQIRVLIWLEDFDYLIILRERSTEMILITAYCVEQESYREKLRQEREDFYKMQKPPFQAT
jgi:hypothetical protein